MRTKQLYVSIHIRIKGKVGTVKQVWPSSNFLTGGFKAVLLLWLFFVICVFLCHILSVSCSLVVTCWERVDLLAILSVMFFVHTVS